MLVNIAGAHAGGLRGGLLFVIERLEKTLLCDLATSTLSF